MDIPPTHWLNLWPRAKHPVGEEFRVRSGQQQQRPCLRSQTVFPFIPSSADGVYFGAALRCEEEEEEEEEAAEEEEA
jgi:hypothetical protein